MKQFVFPLAAVLLLSCLQSPASAQESQKDTERAERSREKKEQQKERLKEKYPATFKEHISKQYSVQKAGSSIVAIYNLEGSVKVEGYAGDKVLIEIDKTIFAKDNETLEQGKKEIKIGFEQIGDSIVAYTQEPWDTRPHDWKDRNEDWRNQRKIDYRCALEYTIKVPFNANLRLNTVNNGDIDVKDVAGTLHINNVNGAVAITNAKGTTHAKTINGDLTINYVTNPPQASSFYTLNGKLTAAFQPNLSADLQFKTMNGAFYTDFPDAEILPATVIKNIEKKGEGVIYKLNKDTQLRIGSGNNKLKFETLNGNIYIKKQS